MKDIKHALHLMTLAQNDLKALRGMLSAEIFTEEIFGFHAQQAVEKTLKAWLALLGREYPITHNISILLERLKNCGTDVEPYWDLIEFNVFAVKFRYEALDAATKPMERSRVIRQVQDLIEKVEKLLKEAEKAG